MVFKLLCNRWQHRFKRQTLLAWRILNSEVFSWYWITCFRHFFAHISVSYQKISCWPRNESKDRLSSNDPARFKLFSLQFVYYYFLLFFLSLWARASCRKIRNGNTTKRERLVYCLDYYNLHKLYCLVFPYNDLPIIQIQRWRKNRLYFYKWLRWRWRGTWHDH